MARITGPPPMPTDDPHQGTTAVGNITAETILVRAVIAGYVAVAVTVNQICYVTQETPK